MGSPATSSTIMAKAAIKDSARVLYGQPGYAVVDLISKAMPWPVMGKDIRLAGVFDAGHKRYSEASEVRALHETDPQVKEIMDTARGAPANAVGYRSAAPSPGGREARW